jgi:hypothetical protein
MTKIPPGLDLIGPVEAYYDEWRRRTLAEVEGVESLPEWLDLTAEQIAAWMLSYASLIEMSVYTTKAVSLVAHLEETQ